jgi:hypothetical protein
LLCTTANVSDRSEIHNKQMMRPGSNGEQLRSNGAGSTAPPPWLREREGEGEEGAVVNGLGGEKQWVDQILFTIYYFDHIKISIQR